MRVHLRFRLHLLIRFMVASLLLVVCPSVAARTLDLHQNSDLRLHFNADGSLTGIAVTNLDDALFQVDKRDLLGSLKRWIMANAAVLKLAPIDDTNVLSEVRLSSRPPVRFDALTVHRFEQTYRGYPVVGTQAGLHLTVTTDGRAIALTGTVLDPRLIYAGIDQRRTMAEAAQVILAVARARDDHGGGSPAFGSPAEKRESDPTLGAIELVAVPHRQSMGYRAQVMRGDKLTDSVLVDAVSGVVLSQRSHGRHDAFDHLPVYVLASEMADDPNTTSTQLFSGLRGSIFSGRCPPHPPTGGCQLRMGDDRVAVYDFRHDNNSVPQIWLTPQYVPHPTNWILWSAFKSNNQNSFQFRTQNMYQKAHAALNAIDPLKITAGWDHHPNAPFGVFDRAPLSIFTNVDGTPERGEANVCDGGEVGLTFPHLFTSEWNQVQHPYVSNTYTTAAIVLCAMQRAQTLFHELGHYYDMHTEYGFMGDGLVSDTCIWDTPDEAEALAETVADMTVVYLYNQLYAGIGYTLETTSTPCAFGSLGLEGIVHGPSCTDEDDEIHSFQQDRPDFSTSQACNVSSGYRQRAIMQAFWEYTSGRNCVATAPYLCATFPSIPNHGMRAMLYALSLSNLQSYEQFFEHMHTYISVTYGQAEASRFRSIMQHHDIL